MGDGFQIIDILFFAAIAAFLILRLRSVLGRRDGHEGGYKDPFRQKPAAGKPGEDNVIPLPDRSAERAEAETAAEPVAVEPTRAPTPVEAGLTQIKLADASFDERGFLGGARAAFEMILGAYAAGDAATLKTLLSADVLANFSRAIDDRKRAGEILENTLVGVRSPEVVEAYMEGRTAYVTAKFVSEQINVTRDENGDVVDGDPGRVTKVTDFWTFARDTKSRDPNWTLVATRSPEE
jgi:predicted lipid-binding transport protein (Tim44 family)